MFFWVVDQMVKIFGKLKKSQMNTVTEQIKVWGEIGREISRPVPLFFPAHAHLDSDRDLLRGDRKNASKKSKK